MAEKSSVNSVAPVRERREPDKHRTEGAEGGLEVGAKLFAETRRAGEEQAQGGRSSV